MCGDVCAALPLWFVYVIVCLCVGICVCGLDCVRYCLLVSVDVYG